MALEEVDMSMQEYDYKKWTNLRGQSLQDYNRQNNSKKSGCGTEKVFQSTWKWYKRLEFLKSGEIALRSIVERIDLDTPALDKSMEILNSKRKEHTEADDDAFGKMVAITLKQMNPYQKNYRT